MGKENKLRSDSLEWFFTKSEIRIELNKVIGLCTLSSFNIIVFFKMIILIMIIIIINDNIVFFRIKNEM